MTGTEAEARRLEKALADDQRTHELGIVVHVSGDRLIAEGEVASQERRSTVLDVLAELAPELRVTDQLTVSADALDGSPGHEHIAQGDS